jgi:hypothetical protein
MKRYRVANIVLRYYLTFTQAQGRVLATNKEIACRPRGLMRAVIQFLFVAFYMLSGYATAQSRVVYFTDELQHSATRLGSVVLDDGCKAKPHYTNFREARKAGSDYNQPTGAGPDLSPLDERHSFHSPIAALDSDAVEIDTARAPPFTSLSSLDKGL